MTPRIIFLWPYYGDVPAEDVSEILSELQKYWEVLNDFLFLEQVVLSG